MPNLVRLPTVIKDIHIPKVQDVSMAIVKETDGTTDGHQDEWGVYLINYKEVDLTNIIVASKGYGRLNNEHVKTSTLRHFFEDIKKQSFLKVETIMPDVFGLNNEYMLTFYIDKLIHDRKFIFVPDSIVNDNLIRVPLVGRPGILIR